MELKTDEYIRQLYEREIEAIIEAFIRIEQRLSELKLEKFATCVKSLVIALSIEELNKSKILLKNQEKKVKELATTILNYK